MNILVAKNGSQLGPFSESDIRAKLASGELTPTDLGWKEGMPAWSPLSQMFADAPSQPAPAPPAYAPPTQAYPPQGQQPQPSAPQPYNPPQGQYSAPQTYNSPYPSPYQQGATPWGNAPGASGYAGFWLRVVAFIIDAIILNIVMFFVGLVIGFVVGATRVANQDTMITIVYLISFAVNFSYFTIMESSPTQATLGKQVLGLKVTDMNGNRIGFGQAAGRYLGKILSALILAIGFFMAGFTERKQGLHDLMAGTLVVRK